MAWLTGWSYRNKLTLDSSKIDASLSDFPVKVILDDDNFDFAKALFTGNDIRFTSSDGETLLKYEREVHLSNHLLYTFSGASIPAELSAGNGLASAVITSGQLVLEANDDTYTDYDNASVNLPVSLTGDFWIQADLEWVGRSSDFGRGLLQIKTATEYLAIGFIDAWASYGPGYSVFGDTAGNLVAPVRDSLSASGSMLIDIKRSGSTLYFYKDGVQLTTYTCSDEIVAINLTNTRFQTYNGKTVKWDNLRIVDFAGSLDFDDYSAEGIADGIGVYHVKVPTVSSSSNTDVYLYYGNSGASDGADAENVWDSDFKLVYHMGSDGCLDSTSNSKDGTYSGVRARLLPSGWAREFDGVDDYINIPDDSSLNPETHSYSMEILCNITNFNDYRMFFDNRQGAGDGEGIAFLTTITDGKPYFHVEGNDGEQLNTNASAVPALTANTDSYLVGTLDVSEDTQNIFIDGVEENSVTSNLVSTCDSTADIKLGRGVTSAIFCFYGLFYEFRISAIARPDAWIKATYNSLADTLLTYGSLEIESQNKMKVIWI